MAFHLKMSVDCLDIFAFMNARLAQERDKDDVTDGVNTDSPSPTDDNPDHKVPET